jgi:hypothetical protein
MSHEPAFPYTAKTLIGYGNDGAPQYIEDTYFGMSLRDYFAAQAMSFLVPLRASHQTPWPELATSAYEMADAMIEERRKP